LLETLQEREISVSELAAKIGISESAIAEIIRGQAPITAEIALQLEQILGYQRDFGRTENVIIESIWLDRNPNSALRRKVKLTSEKLFAAIAHPTF
jgi:transcriptional regulator with XRE-family HTH domain